jgi:hypothetical protein
MGDCDKMNEHISAYLEKTLDPATHAEFEQALQKSLELKNTTDRVSQLTALLEKLPPQKCSDNFVVNLRQRISSTPVSKAGEWNLRRYSFAFSVVLVALVAIFGIKSLLKKDEAAPVLPTVDEFQSAPASVSGGTVNTPVSDYSTEGQLDIKTRAESQMVKDSLDLIKQDQNISPAKQVGHTSK